MVQCNNAPRAQWLVHWENLSPADTTSEDLPFLQATFPEFAPPPPRLSHAPRGQVATEGGGNVLGPETTKEKNTATDEH